MSTHEDPSPASVVLVVDDSEPVRSLIRRILATAGFQAHEAADGVEALALLAQPVHVDVVVTDVRMPNMDGWELAARLARRTPPIPVLLMSGFDAHLASGQLLGPVLAKPFDAGDLLAHVAKLLRGPALGGAKCEMQGGRERDLLPG